MNVNTGLALVASGAAVLYSVVSILRHYLRLRFLNVVFKRYDNYPEVNLKNPDEAELFIKNFLSRHPPDNVGANE